MVIRPVHQRFPGLLPCDQHRRHSTTLKMSLLAFPIEQGGSQVKPYRDMAAKQTVGMHHL